MKSRIGKIASLPIQIRCEVSKRISKKELSGAIAHWLNDQMAVLEVLEEQFDDAPMTELDVEEWKTGGFLEWIPNTDFSEHALVMSEHASDMRAAGLSTNDLFMVVLAMHAQVLRSMDILPSEVVSRRMDMVERMTKSVLSLRRSEQAEARKEIEHARLELAREKQRSKSESSAASPALSSSENPATLRNARPSATPALKSASPDQSAAHLSTPPDTGQSDGDLEIAAPKEADARNPTGAAASEPLSCTNGTPRTSACRAENSHSHEISPGAVPAASRLETPPDPVVRPSTRTGTPSTASARNKFGLL